ncbi:FAD synthase [Malassezia obtusa]|uniref:FAD synthase n=1 Tax=Malassezia obtusa TaxID=76774 RepID=A0AAF0E6H9_9BASI|nr:FAD synthase [Malassezia obtusa]
MAPSPSDAWIRSIDATYALFERPENREAYPALAAKVESAVRIIEAALSEFRYVHDSCSVERCALSFNGGKDCTVLAHILAAVLRRHTNAGAHELLRLEALYVACSSPFQEVEEFIAYAASPETGYNMSLHTEQGSMKEALARYLDGAPGKPLAPGPGRTEIATRPAPSEPPHAPHDVRAMFIGIRRRDPHGSSLEVRAPCDPGWPPIMRVHPILDWDYDEIWAFLRCPVLGTPPAPAPSCVGGGGAHGVPYCALYDQGYTSLGSTYNTRPNPCLAIEGTDRFCPAYKLRDCASERAGRG